LDNAETVLNIGAGAGSYEPKDCPGMAVEPSGEMIAQRPPEALPVKKAKAEALPFQDNSFSHSMTVLSMHHWSDRKAAFNEIKRVTRQRFVAVTWDPESSPFWLTRDYFPEIHAIDAKIFPPLSELYKAFPKAKVFPLAGPENCIDGFLAAYWKRPEAYLSDDVRSCMSTFQKIAMLQEGLKKLSEELSNGAWHSKNQEILHKKTIDAGYRIFVADIHNV
jgi:ubiquinone/menaquinone biosynthesis C-methylase UbiE